MRPFDVVLHEPYRLLPFDFDGCLALFPVVEPCLGPPAHTRPVGIDRDKPRYVEALYVDVQFRQRVYDAAIGQGFVMEFFLCHCPQWRGTHHAAGRGNAGNPQ